MNESSHQAESYPASLGPMPAPGEARPGPWGFWPTVGLSLVIMIGWMLAQVPVVVAFTIPAVTQNRDLDIEAFVEGLMHNGLFWSLAICVAAPVTIVLTLVCTAARKGVAVRDYLTLRWPGGRSLAVWCLIQLAFIACVDGLIYLLRGRIVPPFMVDVYETAYFVPLLWFAFVLVAPVTEELFIRGFLFRGIERSRLGPAGAILLSSLAWAALHTQYDLCSMTVICLGGLLLGFARLRSRSVYPAIAMHLVQNLVATIEVAVCLAVAQPSG